MRFIKNLQTILSQLLNVFIGGDPDMTISTRAYVNARIKGGKWVRIETAINALFFDEHHCRKAFLRDVEYANKIHYLKSRIG